MRRIPIIDIIPPHEVRDEELYQRLLASMRERGWDGRPLLVLRRGDYYQALTGSHRLAAAFDARLEDVPCEFVDEELLDSCIFDPMEELWGHTPIAWEGLETIGDHAALYWLEQEQEANERDGHWAQTPAWKTILEQQRSASPFWG